MQIIKNTLHCRMEVDFQLAYQFGGVMEVREARCEEITGELIVQLTDEEIQNYEADEEEVVKEITLPLQKLGIPKSVLGIAWYHELANDTLTLTPNNDELEAEIDWP